MTLPEAQRDVRRTYIGGLPGLLISAFVWLVSAALATWVGWHAAMWALVVGGALIFIGLEGAVRILHRNPALHPDNPLNPLVLQTAFLLPMLLPLVVCGFLYRADWLYPSFLVALGAHFVPFMFLFGMWHFGALGILLFGSGLVFGLASAEHFAIAGWYGALVQAVFGFIGFEQVRREARMVNAQA